MKRIKVLVTAGPTQVKIDPVRLISSVSTGNTGYFIARELSKTAEVTLLLGKTNFEPKENKGLVIKRFILFDDLRCSLRRELSEENYAVVIHAAAVSDYLPQKKVKNKLRSGKEELEIKLKPAPKLIKDIRKASKDIFLVQFKLEVDKPQPVMVREGIKSLNENESDLVVVNNLEDVKQDSYKALAIDKGKNTVKIGSRKELVDFLRNKIFADTERYT
jgi:phosphopantothenoylcysteine decarboxylase / phosphopantothenate---cysteine ligase